MNESFIDINNSRELHQKMKSMDFFVEWRVTSDIGPDWIGSFREINFYLDDFMLKENQFCKELKEKLIQIIAIPSESQDHVITGEGDITIDGNSLMLDYSWEAAIPYQDPDQSEAGTVLFLKL